MLYFLKFKDLMCNFCAFSRFFIFLSQFLPDLNENYIKIWRKCRATRLPSRFGPEPVFSCLSQKNWEDQDRWSA